MKIAIIGTGNVGGTLAKSWGAKGHKILLGVRDTQDEKTRTMAKGIGSDAEVLGIRQAVERTDIVVLATPWEAAKDALGAAGDLSSKILIDVTNPLKPDLSGLSVGHDTSAGQQVAGWARGARVVKAFNTTGFPNMADPKYPDGAATMFICSDDADAKSRAATLARDLGFEVVDAGPLSNARLLEPMAMLWIYLAVKMGMGTNIAFRLMKR